MTISPNRAWSDLPVSPGSVLEEEIEYRGMTQKELAARMGRPTQVINEIVRGKKAITHDTASELQKALGVSAQFWVNMETAYRMTLARQKHREALEAETDALKKFPVNLMQKRGWIPGHSKLADKVLAIQEFLGIASLNNVEQTLAASFRITGGGNYSHEALAVWLKQGEVLGEKIETESFDRTVFEGSLPRIRGMTTMPQQEFMPKLTEICASAGVAFVVVEELPKSGANGVARWLTPDKALIQLSLRWRWADIFWFTFFHEARHLLDNRRRSYVDGPGDAPNAEAEESADRFAADLLIPRPQWDQFTEAGCFSAPDVESFARSIGIDPGIVVGRLQHHDVIPYNSLPNLKSRLIWEVSN